MEEKSLKDKIQSLITCPKGKKIGPARLRINVGTWLKNSNALK